MTAGSCQGGFIHSTKCYGVTHKTYNNGKDQGVVTSACQELNSNASPMPQDQYCTGDGKARDARRTQINVIYGYRDT